MSYEPLFSYLEITVDSSVSENREEKTIHGIVKKLNAITGLYWIVCSWKLAESVGGSRRSNSLEMNKKFSQIFRSLLEKKPLIPNEDGGLLRCFSTIQLSVILGVDHPELERITRDTKDFSTQILSSQNLPFWFDMRSMYCLLGILKLTKNLKIIPTDCRDWLAGWICDSQSILGGFGANPQAEAHGGYTFCAVASLIMLGREIPKKNRLVAWCKSRMFPRFNGRPGKPSDSCYIWWISATLRNLNEFVDTENLGNILKNHFSVDAGGFSKYPSVPIPGDDQSVHGKQEADLFHTFLAVASIALFDDKIDSICVIPIS